MPRINDGGYYRPPKKPTPPTTKPAPQPPKTAQPVTPPNTWEQQSYWERKAEQTRLEQEKRLQQMETALRNQWIAANQPKPVQSFFTGMAQAGRQFLQNTFVAPFTGQYYTPPQVNPYAYNQTFQQQLTGSALARSLAAAKPRSQVLMEMTGRGYNIPNYAVPAPTRAGTQTYGGQNVRRWWTNTMEQYGPTAFALNVNERPIQPYTGPTWQEAYLPEPTYYGGWGGWGGGGGSYDYTSNPFYRGAETTRKPTYYETYLTWRVK